jgi:hypothetical protein
MPSRPNISQYYLTVVCIDGEEYITDNKLLINSPSLRGFFSSVFLTYLKAVIYENFIASRSPYTSMLILKY